MSLVEDLVYFIEVSLVVVSGVVFLSCGVCII